MGKWDRDKKDINKAYAIKPVIVVDNWNCHFLGNSGSPCSIYTMELSHLQRRELGPSYTSATSHWMRAAPGRMFLRTFCPAGRWADVEWSTNCICYTCSAYRSVFLTPWEPDSTMALILSWSSCSCIVLSHSESGLALPGRSDDVWLLSLCLCLRGASHHVMRGSCG